MNHTTIEQTCQKKILRINFIYFKVLQTSLQKVKCNSLKNPRSIYHATLASNQLEDKNQLIIMIKGLILLLTITIINN